MSITPEEQKRRQAVLEREGQAIAELNDLGDLRRRVREEKKRNNDRVSDDVETEQKKKSARPFSTDVSGNP